METETTVQILATTVRVIPIQIQAAAAVYSKAAASRKPALPVQAAIMRQGHHSNSSRKGRSNQGPSLKDRNSKDHSRSNSALHVLNSITRLQDHRLKAAGRLLPLHHVVRVQAADQAEEAADNSR
jgi:hypothetical protein